MNLEILFGKYKDQNMFKVFIGIIIFFVIIKTAIFGYQFGQWLAH